MRFDAIVVSLCASSFEHVGGGQSRSATRMSGRRLSKSEGKPTRTSGGSLGIGNWDTPLSCAAQPLPGRTPPPAESSGLPQTSAKKTITDRGSARTADEGAGRAASQ